MRFSCVRGGMGDGYIDAKKPVTASLARDGQSPNLICCAAVGCSVAHKTQRSGPGQAHDRRQYESYGKVAQQRQEGFVRRSQPSFSNVVFSSVYFSSACSDLSRPLPDCL